MHLTETQQQTLRAAMNRIIPPDDFPGAWEAGVGDYLSRQFDRELQPLLPLYRDALDALDAEALARHNVAFATLDTVQQDALLQAISEGKVETEWPVTPATFFTTFVHHVNEGFYADPGNGGNRDHISWKMTGFKTD